MRLRFSIASILLATTPALAATITLRPQTPDRPIVVMVEGPLVAVDEDQFAAKSAPLSSAFVAFSSDGGSLVAGLRIGEAIRRKGFSTIVPDGRRCASACALAWLGGVERFIGTSGKISFHAAYDPASDRRGRNCCGRRYRGHGLFGQRAQQRDPYAAPCGIRHIQPRHLI